MELSRPSLDPSRARYQASLQANGTRRRLGCVAAAHRRNNFRRNLWPSRKTPERRRAVSPVCFLRSDGLDLFLTSVAARRQQSRSQFPTCFESLFSAIAHSAGPHARRPRRFRGHVRRPSHRDVDLRVFADAAVSRDPRFPPADDFYRQEFSLGNAEDLAEVKSLSAHVTVPYGSFNNCLKTLESSSLAPGDLEHKFYAAGVGNLLTVDLATGEREELVKIATE